MIAWDTTKTTAVHRASKLHFARLLLGESSEAETEEAYIAFARVLLMRENPVRRASNDG